METAGTEEMPDNVERRGLGTSATRAGIIEKLVRIGFLERVGDKKTKHLIPTQKGTALIAIVPEQIQSPSMTAEWEQKLKQIEQKKYAGDAFMNEIKNTVADLVNNYEVMKDAGSVLPKDVEVVGKCPACGGSVKEKRKGYFCSDCKFALWQNNRYFESIGKYIDAKTAKKLLKDGRIKMKGCKSRRTGRNFDAVIVMSLNEENKPVFSMEFENNGGRTNERV